MIWNDKGYLISKNKYNENSIIAEFFTENHGKVSGVIFGASSKKIRNYLFLGNSFHLNFNLKNDVRIGYFKAEIEKIKTPIFLENKKKLSCIIYTMNILKILTVENQVNIHVYNLINNFFEILEKENWIKNFILWELNFYKNIGYDINFTDYVSNKNENGKSSFTVNYPNSKRMIPTFLIDKSKEPLDKSELFTALKLVGDFLDKTILKPNNVTFPNSRLEFINLLK